MLADTDKALRDTDPSGEASLKAARLVRKELLQLGAGDLDPASVGPGAREESPSSAECDAG